MEKSRNIFSWIGLKEEKEVLALVRLHIEKSFECIKDMKEVFTTIEKKDFGSKTEAIRKAKEHEHQGDEIRRKITTELTHVMFSPPDREDLMSLNERINDIADGAKSVARFLEFINEPLDEPLINHLIEDGTIAVEAGEKLEKAVEFLIENNPESIFELCNQIEELEDEGDDKKRELLKDLVESGTQGPMLIILYEIIEGAEGVIDSINRVGELIRILGVKSK